MKVSEDTSVSMPIKNMVGVLAVAGFLLILKLLLELTSLKHQENSSSRSTKKSELTH